MRTDLKLNYEKLKAVKKRIGAFKKAIAELETVLSKIKRFLGEQDSEAVKKLKDRIDDVIIEMNRKEEVMGELKKIVGDYISSMQNLVKEEYGGQTRVDIVDISYNLQQIGGSINELESTVSWAVRSGYYIGFGEEAERKRRKYERNYWKLEEFRSSSLTGLVSSLRSQNEELQDIYKKYIKTYEQEDDAYRTKINSLYDRYTSQANKEKNSWNTFKDLSKIFLEKFIIAMVLACATVLAAAVLPWLALVGAAVILVAGCVVLANTPEEKVPNWLQGAKKTSDAVADKAVQMVKEGPQVLVEDIGQGFMDTIQTPEGIAAVSGETLGSLAGGFAGAKLKPMGGAGAVDDVGKGASGAKVSKDIKYSPINPGPLSDDVANNFNAATYTKKVLTEDTVMYRVHGGGAGKVGSYLSKTPQGGGLQSQLDLALNPSWGNTTEVVTKVVVPKGTVIYDGVAAPQNILDSLGNTIGTLPGGGNQIYIPKVEVGWFK